MPWWTGVCRRAAPGGWTGVGWTGVGWIGVGTWIGVGRWTLV